MSLASQRINYRKSQRPSAFAGFDPILTVAVAALLVIGTLLVYAATRNWYAAIGLDPEYYLKRDRFTTCLGNHNY